MKTLFTLLACLLACGASFAQKLNKISGKIVDDKAVPVSFALVRVLNYPDTTVVRNASTNIDGEFSIDQLKSGDYVLSVSMVGFKSKKTAKFSLNGDLNMPVISIESLTRQLKEVSVQARKPFVEHQIDKTVLNVENSIVSSGSTALEILEKAPGVQIDRQNEQILLNNKSGVMVMIDGKNNFLSASDLTVYLNSLNSSQIATIEIITNPSAKYDAAGNSGIINIKLKKNKAFGTNGSISSTYRNAIRANLPTNIYGSELNFNLNHRVKKWNFYTNANASKNNNFSNLFLDRSTNSNGLQSLFNQNFQKIYTGSRLAAKLGADYFVSDKTTIGVMLDGSTSTRKLDNFSQTFITEAKADAVNKNSLIQYSDANTPNKNYSLNFNLKHDFKKEGASLNFDADYSGFDYSGLENFNANFYDAKGALYNNTIIRNNSKIAIDIYAAKTDFTWPISKSTKIETGLKSTYVKTNNDFLSSSLINNEWQNIVGQSNNFIYKENVNAAYANLSKDWGKWQLQAGLRAEYTQSTGTSVTNNTETKQHYLSLFPTVFVNQKISESSNLRYSYGRRIDRPNYQQLNPFNFYMDPYTIAQGNPYLKPQFTNNFEVSYNYKSGLSFSLGYSKTKDLILDSKTAQNDSTRIVTVGQGNIGSGQYYTAGLYFPLTIAKWWSLQSNFNLFYNKFKDDNLEGAPFTLSKVMYNFNINSSITLPDNWTFETNFWLNSPRVRGIERTTIYQKALNMGVQKSFLNKALRLRLNVDDIFQSNYWKGTLDYQNVNLRVQNNYISRRASFSISYNFGNQNLKSNQNRKTAADDIKNRAGG
ncbi:outer membrane beta-barrel family protein [Pedobacter sp.]|uniref:outer membrane beta-barrel family protein n=1 Tax=Pedobacter sp. TaxID=1411316 RepID=UPI0031D614D1